MGACGSAGLKDPLLIDECLYPGLAGVANARGHHATHVVFRGLQGTRDEHLVSLIMRENFVLVTSNGKDFLRLYGRQELHPGLIILIPGNLDREEQIEFFNVVLDAIEPLEDLVNKVVEVYSDRRVEVRDWPAE